MEHIKTITGTSQELLSSEECLNAIKHLNAFWTNKSAPDVDFEISLAKKYIDNGSSICGVIYSMHDNSITGCAVVCIFNNENATRGDKDYIRPCWVEWFAVDPLKRGRNIGRRLIKEVEKWFGENEKYIPLYRFDTKKRKHRKNIYIKSIKSAVQFYERCGYQVLGTPDIEKVEVFEGYFGGESNAVMIKPFPGRVCLDNEKLYLDEHTHQLAFRDDIVDDFGGNMSAAIDFEMGCLPSIPQESYDYWRKECGFECGEEFIGCMLSLSRYYKDSDFERICSKFKNSIIKMPLQDFDEEKVSFELYNNKGIRFDEVNPSKQEQLKALFNAMKKKL